MEKNQTVEIQNPNTETPILPTSKKMVQGG